ncbi:hypothetical protein [Hymenobacter sp. B81]|uniref:hypothetical protein n=1 Tax=Hymenobacter sp. B81 TaxID=3344878 RepID=UPI0037DC28A1
MGSLDRVRSWVEAGKQIGKTFCYERNGQRCWLSVGIQRWEGIYKLYLSEISEANIVAEEFLRDETIPYASFEELLIGYAEQTDIPMEELTPLKGQKLFNPRF